MTKVETGLCPGFVEAISVFVIAISVFVTLFSVFVIAISVSVPLLGSGMRFVVFCPAFGCALG